MAFSKVRWAGYISEPLEKCQVPWALTRKDTAIFRRSFHDEYPICSPATASWALEEPGAPLLSDVTIWRTRTAYQSEETKLQLETTVIVSLWLQLYKRLSQ